MMKLSDVGCGARLALMAFVMACAGRAGAQDIRISKSGSGKADIDLSGLTPASPQGANLKTVVRDDLRRSGWFNVLEGNAGITVRGTCAADGGQVSIDAELVNVGTSRRYFSRRYEEPSGSWRRAAHHLADDIVKAVKGTPGMASSRIAFVGSAGGRKDLYLCDADGQGLVQVTRDGKPCLSPAWTTDMASLYYMSFYKGYGDVYRIDLGSQKRTRAVSYPGMNASPTPSPDGQSLAVILSKDGNADVYVKQLASGTLVRITNTRQAAEASPAWTPDGSQLAFVSDRSGSPQIYLVARAGGAAKRLTFRGGENVAPSWSADGRLAFTSKRDGRYQICVMTPGSGDDTQLTGGGADYEDPTWAPDQRHLICAKTQSYHANLYVLDTLGDPEVRLSTLQGDSYSPAWSPR